MTRVGAAIREARTARGWSQETLAEVMGCSKAATSALETGRRGLSHRMRLKLSAAFGDDPRHWAELVAAQRMAMPPSPPCDREQTSEHGSADRVSFPVLVGGRLYSPAEAVAVIVAARRVYRSCRSEWDGGGRLLMEVDGRALWALGTALDKECE